MFGALHGQAPAYINQLLQPYNTSSNLRSSDQGLLIVPHSRLKAKGDYAFKVVAVLVNFGTLSRLLMSGHCGQIQP